MITQSLSIILLILTQKLGDMWRVQRFLLPPTTTTTTIPPPLRLWFYKSVFISPTFIGFLKMSSPVHDASSFLTRRALFEVLSAFTASPTIDETKANKKLNVLSTCPCYPAADHCWSCSLSNIRVRLC